MHQSKLSTIVIDCPPEQWDAALAFWQALFGNVIADDADTEHRYVSLKIPVDHVELLLQRTDDAPGVHLDVETDNVEAEVERVQQIGAVKVRGVKDWQVMEAPGGHRFCIVPKHTKTFPAGANQWPAREET
ncbi:VOC family protein [Acanthopleuribacter pedis]|uniref:Glyoxalase-like domain-containing protein n=1 Tax=Acanthopleuribacter pedis TaxID=442870 RepID=A0A8J7QB19_9BACT|nr:VOC family protein [Acanthopleuribacter pedis]MBO1320799.1 hypothetical protein [Acanthopleuribacter pedis]